MKVADFSEGVHVPQGKNSWIAVNLDESLKTTGFSKVSVVKHCIPSFESCRNRNTRSSFSKKQSRKSMNLEQLKAIQAPIKEKYRTEPNSAMVTIRSHGIVDVNQQHCTIRSHSGTIRAGLHPSAGGTPDDACSAELLLESLVACAGVTFSAVATNMGIEILACRIEAEGDMDFRGTLGVDRAAPVGLTGIRLKFQMESDADIATLDKLVSLTERYCVIYQTLIKGIPIATQRVSN